MVKRNKLGHFPKIPDGVKTPKMLEVEKRLGKTLEEDFDEFYVRQGKGQKELARRWGVPRGLIFSENMRGPRSCWAKKLTFPVRRESGSKEKAPSKEFGQRCELCSTGEARFHGAHWVPRAEGGSDRRHNVLRLCPKCHDKLDNLHAPETVSVALEVILFRETKRLTESKLSDTLKRSLLKELCCSIINRTPLSEATDKLIP